MGAPVGTEVVGIDDGADETGLTVGVGVGSGVGDAEGKDVGDFVRQLSQRTRHVSWTIWRPLLFWSSQ